MSEKDLGAPVGAMVRALRERALLSQDELAARSGLSVGTIRGLESGRIRRPRASSLRMLADSLELQGDQLELLVAAARDEAPYPPAAVPAQLPATVSGFAGRVEALKALDEMISREGAGPAPVVITAIGGAAGVGKTALAVHWAHRVAGLFPDGQLYVNLRGFDAAAAPTVPTGVVRSLLETLGVPAHHIPSSVDAQLGLYRSRLAGRRMLILLDNARNPDQVRPLLPGAPGCLVLVTSRNELSGLVAAQGARPLPLGPLPEREARELLTLRLGADRVAAEADAADAIIRDCAGLPLALAIVAARGAVRADVALAALATELADANRRLDALSGGDPQTDVRAVFSWSYRVLTGAAARMFRLIGLHPGPDLTVPAAASLAAVPLEVARGCLSELAAANLLQEHAFGRYAMHDLLRAYSSELGCVQDSRAERDAALRRLLDHYLQTVYRANGFVKPRRDRPPIEPPQSGVVVSTFQDNQEALRWCTAEREVLLAVTSAAAEHGFDTHAWQLAREVSTSLAVRSLWHDSDFVGHIAVEAARRSGDPTGQAYAHDILGIACYEKGRWAQAREHIERSIDLFTSVADLRGAARSRLSLGMLCDKTGDPDAALEHSLKAFAVFESIDDIDGMARSLNNIGWCYSLRGQHRLALTTCHRALALYRELGSPGGQAYTLHSIASAHQGLGEHRQALDYLDQTMALVRQTGDRYLEGLTLDGIGDSLRAEGDAEAARQAWRHAVRILKGLAPSGAEPPHVAALEAKLAAA